MASCMASCMSSGEVYILNIVYFLGGFFFSFWVAFTEGGKISFDRIACLINLSIPLPLVMLNKLRCHAHT